MDVNLFCDVMCDVNWLCDVMCDVNWLCDVMCDVNWLCDVGLRGPGGSEEELEWIAMRCLSSLPQSSQWSNARRACSSRHNFTEKNTDECRKAVHF